MEGSCRPPQLCSRAGEQDLREERGGEGLWLRPCCPWRLGSPRGAPQSPATCASPGSPVRAHSSCPPLGALWGGEQMGFRSEPHRSFGQQEMPRGHRQAFATPPGVWGARARAPEGAMLGPPCAPKIPRLLPPWLGRGGGHREASLACGVGLCAIRRAKNSPAHRAQRQTPSTQKRQPL